MTDFQYDFSGIASKYNTKCSDGRVIRHGAFKDCNGKIVPVVWQHDHKSAFQVMGKALLQERADDLYAYVSLNDSDLGNHVKECVKHGDLSSLSVFANHLTESRKVVSHGDVKEVSVVLAGANPGAHIDNVLVHGEDDGTCAEIRFFIDGCLSDESGIIHSDEIYGDEDDYDEEDEYDDEEDEDEEASADDGNETPKEAMQHSDVGGAIAHADDDRSVSDVLNGIGSKLDEKEKAALEFAINTVVAKAVEAATNNSKEEDEMRHSLFDSSNETARPYLTKAEQAAFIQHMDDDHITSLNAAITAFIDDENATLAHDDNDDPAQTYGIINSDLLFPDAKNYTDKPEFIKRRTEWVNVVLTGVHKTPFSKVKTIFADITADEARAKGYIKGDQKEDEVFELLQRETGPQTIYKRQKFDRDDRIDIVDFDVVIWIKGEMRLMWEEEVARAILIGDGRGSTNRLKIKEDKIRPIWTDAALFTIPVRVPVAAGTSDDARTRAIIRAIIKNRKQYKGSGSPILFTTEDFIADCLLLTDDIGRDMYDSIDKLATKLRVSRIVPVEVMENKSRSVALDPEAPTTLTTVYLDALLVNLSDYNVGADKGGKAEMFEDFDLDFNQYIFLYEGRCSGALVKPYSAMAIEHYTAASSNNQAAG